MKMGLKMAWTGSFLGLISISLFYSSSYLVRAQFDDFEADGEYSGKFIGSLSSYHHQVSGDVYAVNEYTLLFKDFVYDGNGEDAFFWAGNSNQPGPDGFLVPNEQGRTNVLTRYLNEEFTIKLPDGKKITDIKWFAIYDLTLHSSFGDFYIADEFQPPIEQVLADIKGTGVRSGAITVIDSKTIKVPQFTYDGRGGGVYFWAGVGHEPSPKGDLIPDELGYVDPLRRYTEEDLILELPGKLTVFQINWFAVYNKDIKRNLGYIVIPENLNIPPSLSEVVPRNTKLPNCQILHKNLMISWSTFAPSITISLSGVLEDDEYMAFGISEDGKSEMIGSDAAVAYIDGYLGVIEDYNMTAKTPCSRVLGINRGVCQDSKVKGGVPGGNQLQTYDTSDGITTISFRRTLLTSSDPGDKEIYEDRPTSIVWAIGKLARNGRKLEPAYHHTYAKVHTQVDFGSKDVIDNCWDFTMSDRDATRRPWAPVKLFDPTLRTFDARLGPSGSKRGYSGITNLPSTGLVWYINGYMTPELFLRRGLTYSFRVEGGKDPYSAENYHPLVITSDKMGGYDRLDDEQKSEVKIFAGVEYTRRNVARPTASGRLCMWKHREGDDRRLDDRYNTFERYRNSLKLECDKGDSEVLEVTPNNTWPDVVYYQSFTRPYMGWKIHIIDNFNRVLLIQNGAEKTAIGQLLMIVVSIATIRSFYYSF